LGKCRGVGNGVRRRSGICQSADIQEEFGYREVSKLFIKGPCTIHFPRKAAESSIGLAGEKNQKTEGEIRMVKIGPGVAKRRLANATMIDTLGREDRFGGGGRVDLS